MWGGGMEQGLSVARRPLPGTDVDAPAVWGAVQWPPQPSPGPEEGVEETGPTLLPAAPSPPAL